MTNRAEGTEALYVDLPRSIKYLVDSDERTNKDVVVAALERELGVTAEDSVAIIDRQIRRKEQRFEDAKQAVEEDRDRLRRLQSDLEQLRAVREDKVETDGSYEDRQDRILDDMETGDLAEKHLIPQHVRVRDLAAEFGRSAEEVHLDLQQRAAEQDRDISHAQFKNGLQAEAEDWRTPIADVWGADE